MNWTEEQTSAIYKKDTNVLVAAAAGSGKTAVLVERIIQKILKYGIDIDKLLVVTFTNAAASEMRERVLEAIYKKIEEEPDNENLQKQIILLGKSNICTIHSFCLDVIKNNFYEIDLSANFRIGAEEEIELLKLEVLEDLFEELYETENEDFAKLVDTYTGYRGDEPLKDLILNLYKFIQSSPFPNEWLDEKIDLFKITNEKKDFSESIWGDILLKNIRYELEDSINSLKIVKNTLDFHTELDKYSQTLENDINMLKDLYYYSGKSWDESFEFYQNMKFKSWPIDKKITMDLKNEAKEARDKVKNKIMKFLSNILIYTSEEAYQNIYQMYDILKILENVVIIFDSKFKARKKERNLIDFNDIEHYALKILVRKNENGEYEPTEVAKKYRKKFEEIAIDEYQDSNEVQEYILSTISRGNNIFMVGDVKQSIYKFRQACPELFLEKYNSYSLDGNENGLKIQLFKNFRSRKNVLDLTNIVFQTIMSKELGDIDYNEEEYLNLGANYGTVENGLKNAEIHIIDLEKEEPQISAWKNEEEEIEDTEDADESLKLIEKEEIEAEFVSNKIKEIIDSKVQVFDKKIGFRDVTYKDIVILLRSPSKIASVYEKTLLNKDIPVFSDCSNEYLDTIEIQTIINVLKIIDNPINDIALVSVLRSEIGKFNDNEILEIRLCNMNGNYYNALTASKEKLSGELKEKVINFLNEISAWRTECNYLSLAEILWKIYTDTGFYNYVGLMPNGSLRQANLRMLFERAKEYEKTSFKGLFNFIKFIERLKLGNSDMSSAKIIGENEDVVRIMSIHKSKGLEFPIVFLSGTSKKINLRDLNSNLLLHPKIGFGPKYINYDRRIEYSSMAREAIKLVSKEESISEEMRVLYVALTRAKEKIYITGTVNGYKKDIDKKKEYLNIYKSKSNKINPILLKKYTSYLDWIELVMLSNDMEDIITTYSHNQKDVFEKQIITENEIREFDFEKEEKYNWIEEELNWKYKDEVSTTLPIKSTVSKIKQMYLEENLVDLESLYEKQIGFKEIIPNFMENNMKLTGSQKGTIMHLFLQNLNLKQEYDDKKLEDLKQELIAKNKILENEAKTIDFYKVKRYLSSKVVSQIKSAVNVEKEKAFCMKISAKNLFEGAEDEEILVQGIIDLYFENPDGTLILVDYKTDFAENSQNLVEKYKKQLELYKEALEEGTGKKVCKTYIYSLYLGEEIEIKF